VKIGDTLGLMGNTGNSKSTPPHLHFGVYTRGGAVDPLPFIDPLVLPIPHINSDIRKLNATLRSLNKPVEVADNQHFINPELLKQNTIVRVLAAMDNYYRIALPDGKIRYVANKSLVETKPLTSRKITASSQSLLDSPNVNAGVKASLAIGKTVNVIGNFEGFQLVSTTDGKVGWIPLK